MPVVAMVLAVALAWLAAPARAHDDDRHGPAGHGAALGEPGDPRARARTIAVDASDRFRFTPATIKVKRGETIRFVLTNSGGMKHEMVLGTLKELRDHAKLMQKFPDMEHDDPNAASVQPGATSELAWKFTRAGEFYFGCLVPGHFEQGMRGKIVVSR